MELKLVGLMGVLFCVALVGCTSNHPVTLIPDISVGGVTKEIGNAQSADQILIKTAKDIEAEGALAHSSTTLQLVSTTAKLKVDLDNAQVQVNDLQTKVDGLTKSAETMSARLQYLEPKYAAATGLLWKWRLIAAGIGAAVIGFFILRQYLPFLKVI